LDKWVVPSVSNEAAISFKTEFFAPGTRTVPDNGPVRRTRITASAVTDCPRVVLIA
jgi:hypothetical protein